MLWHGACLGGVLERFCNLLHVFHFPYSVLSAESSEKERGEYSMLSGRHVCCMLCCPQCVQSDHMLTFSTNIFTLFNSIHIK